HTARAEIDVPGPSRPRRARSRRWQSRGSAPGSRAGLASARSPPTAMILAGSHVTRHRDRPWRADDHDPWSGGCELAPNRAQTILDRNERVDDIRIELPFSLVEDLRPGGAPAHRAPVWAVAGHGVE